MKTIMIVRWAALSLVMLLAACGGGSGGGSSGNVTVVGEVDVQAEVSPAAVTWYSAAGPLIDRYCVACHSTGGVAPFPLESYEQVSSKRSALLYVLESQTMPPVGYADLSSSESQLLLEWLHAGAPRGDASQAPLLQLAQDLSYHQDARAIIEEKCVNCHEEGGLAPFPLDGYGKVKAVSAAAAFAIENGTMPPWPPTEGYSRFTDERQLTQREKYVLLNWLQGDLAAGDPAGYSPPVVTSEPNPPTFNLKLPLPQAYTPTVRPDDHRCFAIEWPLEEFTYVTEVDVLPDELAEVHHVIVSIAEPEDAQAYYAAGGQDGRPGWYCLGAGGVSGAPLPRQIGGWVPGAGREPAPKGTGIGIKPGSVMVVQMHYNTLVAEPTPDQSTVLVATSNAVDRPATSFLVTDPGWLRPGGMPIPAGEAYVKHEVSLPTGALSSIFGGPAGLTGRDPWVLHNAFIHMHNLGTSGRTTLVRRDGTEQVLLDVRDWDFNWQGTYRFDKEILVSPGDLLKLECTWDNSQENQSLVAGEQLPTQDVEWGDGTQDEMCLMSVLMTQPQEGRDYSYTPSLYIEAPTYRQQYSPGDLVPLKLVLNNFTLHEPVEHGAGGHDMGEHNMGTDDHSAVYSGHYHVYLDTDDDDAPHLTAWDDSYYYQLPDNIAPGLHTLRVNLRGGDHHPLGIEQSVEIEVLATPPIDSRSLIAVDKWAVQPAGKDALAAHRPANVECPDNSWYDEDGALEVETGYCNYLSLAQPSLTGLQAGDTLHLVLWHADLAFEEPASAHVAVSIAGKVVWEAEVAIPAQANIFDVRVPVEFEAPAGTTVEYHLHNHGYNSWTLLELELER